MLKVVTRICQSCSMFFSPYAKQNQAEVWPIFQSLLKLLLWNKVVEWVHVLNALGQSCLWQCFALQCTMFPLSNKNCLNSNKLRPVLNCQFFHAIFKKICLNVFGSKQTREILAFVILIIETMRWATVQDGRVGKRDLSWIENIIPDAF